MFFKFLPFEAPVAWSWKDPDTGRLFCKASKQELIDKIVAYRKQNGLEEIEHLPFVLENYWCGLPENQGRCEAVEMRRGFFGYVKGGIALLKNIAYSMFASQEVADARAEICVDCPLNVFPDTGGFIKWSNMIAEASVGDRKSKRHDELGQCAGCSCPLRAKVFYGGKISLDKAQEEVITVANPKCWQINGR